MPPALADKSRCSDDPASFMCSHCGSVTRSRRNANGLYEGIFHPGGQREPQSRAWDDPHVIIRCLDCGQSKRASSNCVSRSYTKREVTYVVPPKEVAKDPTLEVRTMACKNRPACTSTRVALDCPFSDALRLRYTCLECKHQWCDELAGRESAQPEQEPS